MLKESYIGASPSHLWSTNRVVRSFILSDTFVWSAWNFIAPIFAIFAANQVSGGDIGIAASAYSVYMVVRVVTELIVGPKLAKVSDILKLEVIISGIALVSLGYLGFALATTVSVIYFAYILIGIGIGIGAPAKGSLFSMHLDKGKESMEWSLYDAVVFAGMASSAALGGIIANKYGFRPLFILCAIVNILAIVPYLVYNFRARRLFITPKSRSD